MTKPLDEKTVEHMNQLNAQGVSRDHLERIRMAFPHVNWGKLINFGRKYSDNIQEMIADLIDAFALPPSPVGHPHAEKQ